MGILGTEEFLCPPCFFFIGNRLQPPWTCLSSKEQILTVANQGILTVANQGREGMQAQRRSSLGTIVQPQGRVLAPPQGYSSVQSSSVAQSCPTLCDPMNRSMPGLPVHHQLPEFTQTHVHRVSDAIQPSHPLSSSSPPAPNPSQHQSLFQ